MSMAVQDRDAIVASAVEIESPEEREAFIARACGGDAVLRREVEAMVAAHFQGRRAPDEPVAAGAAPVAGPIDGHADLPHEPPGPREGLWGGAARLAVGALLLALAAGGVGVAVWAWQGKERARATEEQAVVEREQALQDAAQARKQIEQTETARQAVAEARDQALTTAQTARRSAEDTKAVLAFFRDRVLAAGRPKGLSGGLGKDVTLRAAVDAAAPDVAKVFADRPLAEASVREMLGATYRDLGEAPQAVKQFERALALREAALGPDNPATISCRNELAVAYRLAGRPGEASRLYDQNAESPSHAAALAERGAALLSQNKPAEAELKLRECLAVRRRLQPNDWTTFDTQSLLGEALLEQKKYAEAEPLLLEGHEGMKKHEAQIPPDSKARRTQALERLVRLYEAWGKKDQAARWQKALGAAEAAKTR